MTFIDRNWEEQLYSEKLGYRDLPAEKNPNIILPDGKPWIKGRFAFVSPFGPAELWRKVGRGYTDTAMMRKLQQAYPEPPKVIFVSNNEAKRIRWHQVEQCKRYLDRYGKGRSDEFKRKIVGEAYAERYRALIEGMREGLSSKSWREAAIFIGYNAFGPNHYGRWDGWMEYFRGWEDRICWAPLAWDGGSPSAYDNQWQPDKRDYRLWSVQVEMMNLVFMQDEAHRIKPDFWFELSIWDGDNAQKGQTAKPDLYRKAGQQYSAARYGAWVQFVMWLLRPRVVREFRGSTQSVTGEHNAGHWQAILDAVDRVHADAALERFWRHGRLAPNRAHAHPFDTKLLPAYKDADRWFLLETSADPPRPWTFKTEIPVFSLALETGAAPRRQWLLYAHSPLKDRTKVEIRIPEYRCVTVDVPTAGAFYLVDEKAATVRAVGAVKGQRGKNIHREGQRQLTKDQT